MATQLGPASTESEIGEEDNHLSCCTSCGLILDDCKAFEADGRRWHIECFRCSTCATPLDSDANVQLLGNGSLICNDCTYSCSICGNMIEDVAILTGDEAFCIGCFRCKMCKKEIKDLRYARISQNKFCIPCSDQIIARFRKKSSNKRLSTLTGWLNRDKSLPSLPPTIDASFQEFVVKSNASEVDLVIGAENATDAMLPGEPAKEDEGIEISSQASTVSRTDEDLVKLSSIGQASLHAMSQSGNVSLATYSRTNSRLVCDSGYGTGEHYTSKGSAPAILERTDEEILDDDHSDGNVAETVYTSFSIDGLSPTEIYISQLATALFDEIKSLNPERIALDKVHCQLPDLLAAFALRLGYQQSSPLAKQTSAFIYKHRRRIQQLFGEIAIPSQIQDDDPPATDRAEPEDRFALQRFLEDSEHPLIHPDVPLSPALEEDDDDALAFDQRPVSELVPEVHPYRSLLQQSPAFAWLISNVRREAMLTPTSPDTMGRIRTHILRAFPNQQKISRRTPSACHQVILKSAWDPRAFIVEEQFSIDGGNVIERALTLTGTASDAQALATVDYMEQTWPATGRQILRLVDCVTRLGSAAASLPDGASVALSLDSGQLVVNVRGTLDTIVEVVQQVAWLSAALRSSPEPHSISECAPYVRRESNTSNRDALTQVFSLSYMSRKIAGSQVPNGRCWQLMFGNPVLVVGFPIKSRSSFNMGLEMPLSLLPLFTGSNRITHFNGRLCIKGFAAMLVATSLVNDMLTWHYVCNRDGQYLSYTDYDSSELLVSLHQIESARHIVGWCTDSQYRAGAPDAGYNIHRTNLPSPHAGCILEKVTISSGQCINIGASVVLGAKDLGPHLKREGYIDTISAIATRFVVFWDETSKRGWLVNGASALLHLVRAWLHSKNSHVDEELFDAEKIKNGPQTPEGALKVLIDSRNRQLPLYIDRTERFDEIIIDENKQSTVVQKEKRTYYLLEDLIRRFASILEQMFAHQQQLGGKSGVELKARIRKHLEGWDFAELYTARDPSPRVATLHALGYGWVDLIRTIGAITLFGSGFGDIIRPAKDDCACRNWTTLPSHRYYLAASLSDLNEIMHWHGTSGKHTQLVDGLIWHAPQDLITGCACMAREGGPKHCDPVQALYPIQSKIAIMPRSPQAMLDDTRFARGAVIFGHNIVFPYRWRQHGYEGLEYGSPESIAEAQNAILNDQAAPELSTDTQSDHRTSLSPSQAPTTSTLLESSASRVSNADTRSSALTPPSSVSQSNPDRSYKGSIDGEQETRILVKDSTVQQLPESPRGSKLRNLFARKSRLYVGIRAGANTHG